MKTYNHHHHHNHHINDQELFVNPQMIKMVVTNTVHQVYNIYIMLTVHWVTIKKFKLRYVQVSRTMVPKQTTTQNSRTV